MKRPQPSRDAEAPRKKAPSDLLGGRVSRDLFCWVGDPDHLCSVALGSVLHSIDVGVIDLRYLARLRHARASGEGENCERARDGACLCFHGLLPLAARLGAVANRPHAVSPQVANLSLPTTEASFLRRNPPARASNHTDARHAPSGGSN